MRKFKDVRLYDRGTKNIWARVCGGRVSTGHTDERAASLWCDEYERKHADPRYAAAAAATLGPAVTAYLDELRQRKSSAGTMSKETTLTGHLARLLGEGFELSRIDAERVKGLIKTREGEGAKPITVSMLLGTLAGVLKVAKHYKLWRGELVEVMPIRYGKKHTPRKRKPTPDEVKALMQQFRPWRAAHIAYIVATGCRREESFRARRGDENVATGTVHIHGTKTDYAEDDIPITSVSRPWFDWALKFAPGKKQGGLLFSPWGNMSRDIHAACVRAEIAPVTPNDLRRSFGSWHKIAGAHVPDVARMLRHGDDKLAQTTYARVGGEQLGGIVGRQLAAGNQPVPILYDAGHKSETNVPQSDNDGPGKQAPPGEFESPTLALGRRVSDARQVAGKQAWERRRPPSGVPSLYKCAVCGAIPNVGRVFRLVGTRFVQVPS